MFVDACFAGKSYKRGNSDLDDREKSLDIAISTGSKKPKDGEPYKSLIFFGASLNFLQARQTPNGGMFTNYLSYCFNKGDTDKNGDGEISKSELQKCMINAYPNYAKEAPIYPIGRLNTKSIVRASRGSALDDKNLIKLNNYRLQDGRFVSRFEKTDTRLKACLMSVHSEFSSISND